MKSISKRIRIRRGDLQLEKPAPPPPVGFVHKPIRPRYVLHPGHVTSLSDGQQHYIGPRQLMRLYRIDPSRDDTILMEPGVQALSCDVHLYPRADGNYILPE